MRKSFLFNRRGVSPVIATILLSATVIAIGGAVWSYAQGAATNMANDYVNQTMNLIDEVIERFTIEHVTNNSDCSVLRLWIYNYGEVDIVVDVYADVVGGGSYSELEIEIESTMLSCVNVTISASSGDQITIKAHSRRQNNVYWTYYVP